MPLLSLRLVLLLGLPFASVAHGRSLPETDGFSNVDAARWRQEVETVPGESLKVVEDSNFDPKYHEDVVKNGHHGAIAAAHSEAGSSAARLFDLARQDAIAKHYLRRRQDSNTTVSAGLTTTSTVPETSTTVSAPSTESSTELSTAQGQSFTSSTTEMSSTGSSLVTETSVVIQTVSSTTTIVPASSSTTEGQTTPATTSSHQIEVTPSSLSFPSTSSFSSFSTQGQGSPSIVVPVTNPTSATSTSEPARETTPSATTQTGILVPIITSITASDGSVVLSTTNAFETTAQTSLAITTTDSNGQVTSTMAPATIITQTNSVGSTIITTSPVSIVAVAPGGSIVASSAEMVTMTDSEGGTVVLSRPSAGATYTTRDSGGRIATVTYQPGGGTVSQVRVQTTTLPNGQRSTITSFAEVGGETGTGSGSQATAAASSGTQPGLQSGATVPSSWHAAGFAMMGGIFVGVGLLW